MHQTHQTIERTRRVDAADRRGRAFISVAPADMGQAPGTMPGEVVLISPVVRVGLQASEFVVSWNASAPAGTGLKVEAKAIYTNHETRYYTMGLWSADAANYPRESVKGQQDEDGDVLTDTLALKRPADRVQIRVTLFNRTGAQPPHLSFLGVSAAETGRTDAELAPEKSAWGREIAVPGRTQLGWPGASGWCSPTSTDMTMAFWAERLHRPDLDIPVPDAAHAIYDRVWDGTGNWPFNTAFAGSFAGMRAYVTRLSDVRELEEWVCAGIPPIVSVSYDLLKGKTTDADPGHLLVCIGFAPNGDIVLNDPAYSPEKGEQCRKVYSRANFIKGWARSRNAVYLIYPLGSKLPADPYGHWEE